MNNVMLFVFAVATSAAPIFPVAPYFGHPIVAPAIHQTVVISAIEQKLDPLEGAPIEEHVIDSISPPTYTYPNHPVHPKIHHDTGSVFDSTRPHIEYAPGVKNDIASTKSPTGYVRHRGHSI